MFINSMSRMSLITTAIAMALMSGCSVKPATSPSDPILINEVQKIKTFTVPRLGTDDQTNFLFSNNKVFIWKDHTTPPVTEGGERQCDTVCLDAYASDIKLALNAGKLNDDLDDDSKPVYKQRDELKAKIDVLKTDYKSAKSAAEKIISQNKKAQKSTQAQIEELMKVDPPNPENDAKIQTLKDQLAQLKTEALILTEKLNEVVAGFKKVEKDYTDFDETVIQQFDIPLANATRPLMEALGTDAYGNDNWYKDMPSRVVFRFESNGSISVEVKDWTVDGKEKQSFSTEKGLVREVSYEEKGGVFRFKIDNFEDNATRTKLIATYTFELARARYEQTEKDGRLFMAGEFIRDAAVCDLLKEPCKRKGSVKLASY